MDTKKQLKTLRVRIRNKHAGLLSKWAFECNQVWNAANADTAQWSNIPVPDVGWVFNRISAFDLAKRQAAIAKERGFSLHSQTIQEVTEAHAKARKQFKKRLVKTIHAQIKNRRKESIRQFTNKLTKENGLIVVGNFSSSKLAKTKMAKSVLDAGWHMLKTQFEYKAIARWVVILEVNEAFTTKTCSCCGTKAGSKGLSGLNDRIWQCVEWG